jgi:hypothetical protein
LKERRPTCLIITSPHQLKTCIGLPTPRDKLSLELVTSPSKKKSIITFKSHVVDLEEDEERTCSNEKVEVHYYILCLFAKGQTKNLKGLRSKNKKLEGFAKQK